MVLIYIFVATIAILLTLLYKSFGRKIYLASKLAGPPALPIIGNVLLFNNKSPAEIFQMMSELNQKYMPKPFRLWLGTFLVINLTDPKDVEVLCSSQKYIQKSVEYDAFRPWLGDGLLVSKGKKWHQRRKIITPAFHFKILEQFTEIFDRQGRIFINTLSKFKPDEKCELYPLANLFALDVICETAMGTNINAQINKNSDYVRAIAEMGDVTFQRAFDVSIQSDFLFRFSKYYKKQNDALKVLHGFSNKVIKDRHAELVKKQSSGKNDNDDTGIKKKMAFLDMLLQSTVDGKPLGDMEIREEVDTFMIAGHDTTTSGITFALYSLAKYPDIQEKCYQEIINVIGEDRSKPTTLADLNNLQYLEKVLKEVLRLYPPVTLFARQHDEEITMNNVTYPANCSFFVSIFDMNRNPKYFPDPLKFLPERFDGQENDVKVPNYAYVPFSAGPRNCIGQKFAMLEMKSIVSKVVRNFIISLNADSLNEPTFMSQLVLKPVNTVNFHVKSRPV